MQLALATTGLTSWTLPRVVSSAARAGFGAVEFRSFGHDSRFFTPEPALTSPAKLAQMCAQAGLTPVGIASSIAYDQSAGLPVVGHLNPKADLSVERTKQGVGLCSALGGLWVRVFASGPAVDASAAPAGVGRRLAMALRTARHTGVRLQIENAGAHAHAEGLLRLPAGLPGLDFDLAYNTLTGFNAGDDVAKVIPAIAEQLKAITLSDLNDDGQPCPLGDGRLPIAHIVRTLSSAGYAGWLIYEPPTESTEDELKAACQRLHEWWSQGIRLAGVPNAMITA